MLAPRRRTAAGPHEARARSAVRRIMPRRRRIVASASSDIPPINVSWAAMGRSLGASSSIAEDAVLSGLMNRLGQRTLLLIGDSSLRNQFMQLARVGLSFSRGMPSAEAISSGAHTGSFSLPYAIRQPDRPDSSNGFWGGFPWMAFSTPANFTLIYAKVWGCTNADDVIRRMRSVALRHRQHSVRSGGGGWPPHAVMWNYGLHLLHVYPARPVPTTSIACALGYKALVAQSAQKLRTELPAAHLFYRSTNSVCEDRFEASWAVARRAYHCTDTASSSQRIETRAGCGEERIIRVQDSCQRRYNMTLASCVSTFMDRKSALGQRDQAKAALRAIALHPGMPRRQSQQLHRSSLSGPALFDAFAITDARCDATVDGRHYPRLLAIINAHWLTQVVAALAGSSLGAGSQS
jgi:hypothetical protein